MDPQTWGLQGTSGRPSGYSYGRPFVDKPSFDGLPASSLAAAHSSVLAASAIADDWERIETLFERNWFGPCSCLGGVWGTSRPSELDDASDDLQSIATFSSPVTQPAAPAPAAAQQPGFTRISARSYPDSLPDPYTNGNGNGLGAAAVLYGVGAAPVPEPPFPTTTVNGVKDVASPLRPVPVPIRHVSAAAKAEGGDGPLPAAVPIEPPPAMATAAAATEPMPQAAAGRVLLFPVLTPGDSPTGSSSDAAPLAPQLGTWADRQYRLLDPVPERGEFGGPGSASASAHNSIPSSSSNQRSPDVSGRGGGSGAASGGCGSGDGYSAGGGGSSSNDASQAAAPASPTLLELYHKQQQQYAGAANGANGCGNGGLLSADPLEGRRRAGSEPLVLTALQQQQQLLDEERQAQGLAAAPNGTYHNHHHHTGLGPAPPSGPTSAAQSGPNQAPGSSRHPSAFANMDSAAVQAAAEAVMQEAAWRWRFTRRWQAEQARTGPEHASSAPRDQMEEALAYLQATNATTTVSMQIANTSVGGRRGGGRNHGGGGRGGGASVSLEGSLVLHSLTGTLGAATSTLGGDWPLGACGSGSGSFTSGPRILGRQQSGELLQASREVASLNRRAALVLQQQLDCEQQAARRVQESLGQGTPWVGQHIPVVQIDEWGSFRFLMLKLRDQTTRGGGALGTGIGPGAERQRILIRGHNYGSEGQLMEECNREIMALCQKHSVPFEAPTVMGGGVMEWRRDRDRHLHLHSGFVMDRALPPPPPPPMMMGGTLAAAGGGGLAGPGAPNAGGRPASAMDLLNLAAALARQSFPPTYKITVLT